MTKTVNAIAKWIRLRVGGDLKIAKLVLKNSSSEARSVPVDTFTVPSQIELSDIETLSIDILERAQADADGIGGSQKYSLLSYADGEESEKATSRFAFRVQGASDGEDSDFGHTGEDASMAGMVRQLMRHNEALTRQVVGSAGAMLRVMGDQLTIANERIAASEAQRLEYWKAREQSESLQSDRDLALLKASGEEERRNKLIEKASMLAPIVVNHLVGQKVLAGGSATDALVTTFAESLTAEQVDRLRTSLTQEQQLILGNLIQTAKPKEHGK